MRQYLIGDSPIPGYRLERLLGKGSFGQTWKATAPGGVEVALKITVELDGRSAISEWRSLQEVMNLKHPNLCQVNGAWLLDEGGRVLDPSEIRRIIESRLPVDTESSRDSGDDLLPDFLTLHGEHSENLEVARSLPPVEQASHIERAATLPSVETSVPFRSGRQQRSRSNSHNADGTSGSKNVLSELEDLPPLQFIAAMTLGQKTLFDVLKDEYRFQGIPRKELINYLSEAAKGLQFLNDRRILHCDIKPENLLVVGNGVQVCDYGSALKMILPADGKAHQGITKIYAPPELLLGKRVKLYPTTDQYSLAITYYVLRTGQYPWGERRESPDVIKYNETFDLSKLDDLTKPYRFESDVVARALRRDPIQRYPKVTDFVEALIGAANQEDIDRRLKTTRLRSRVVAGVVCGLVLLLCGIGWRYSGAIAQRFATERLADIAAATAEPKALQTWFDSTGKEKDWQSMVRESIHLEREDRKLKKFWYDQLHKRLDEADANRCAVFLAREPRFQIYKDEILKEVYDRTDTVIRTAEKSLDSGETLGEDWWQKVFSPTVDATRFLAVEFAQQDGEIKKEGIAEASFRRDAEAISARARLAQLIYLARDAKSFETFTHEEIATLREALPSRDAEFDALEGWWLASHSAKDLLKDSYPLFQSTRDYASGSEWMNRAYEAQIDGIAKVVSEEEIGADLLRRAESILGDDQPRIALKRAHHALKDPQKPGSLLRVRDALSAISKDIQLSDSSEAQRQTLHTWLELQELQTAATSTPDDPTLALGAKLLENALGLLRSDRQSDLAIDALHALEAWVTTVASEESALPRVLVLLERVAKEPNPSWRSPAVVQFEAKLRYSRMRLLARAPEFGMKRSDALSDANWLLELAEVENRAMSDLEITSVESPKIPDDFPTSLTRWACAVLLDAVSTESMIREWEDSEKARFEWAKRKISENPSPYESYAMAVYGLSQKRPSEISSVRFAEEKTLSELAEKTVLPSLRAESASRNLLRLILSELPSDERFQIPGAASNDLGIRLRQLAIWSRDVSADLPVRTEVAAAVVLGAVIGADVPETDVRSAANAFDRVSKGFQFWQDPHERKTHLNIGLGKIFESQNKKTAALQCYAAALRDLYRPFDSLRCPDRELFALVARPAFKLVCEEGNTKSKDCSLVFEAHSMLLDRSPFVGGAGVYGELERELGKRNADYNAYVEWNKSVTLGLERAKSEPTGGEAGHLEVLVPGKAWSELALMRGEKDNYLGILATLPIDQLPLGHDRYAIEAMRNQIQSQIEPTISARRELLSEALKSFKLAIDNLQASSQIHPELKKLRLAFYYECLGGCLVEYAFSQRSIDAKRSALREGVRATDTAIGIEPRRQLYLAYLNKGLLLEDLAFYCKDEEDQSEFQRAILAFREAEGLAQDEVDKAWCMVNLCRAEYRRMVATDASEGEFRKRMAEGQIEERLRNAVAELKNGDVRWKHAESLYWLGLAGNVTGERDRWPERLRTASRIAREVDNPDWAAYLYKLGALLRESGAAKEAQACFREIQDEVQKEHGAKIRTSDAFYAIEELADIEQTNSREKHAILWEAAEKLQRSPEKRELTLKLMIASQRINKDRTNQRYETIRGLCESSRGLLDNDLVDQLRTMNDVVYYSDEVIKNRKDYSQVSRQTFDRLLNGLESLNEERGDFKRAVEYMYLCWYARRSEWKDCRSQVGNVLSMYREYFPMTSKNKSITQLKIDEWIKYLNK